MAHCWNACLLRNLEHNIDEKECVLCEDLVFEAMFQRIKSEQCVRHRPQTRVSGGWLSLLAGSETYPIARSARSSCINFALLSGGSWPLRPMTVNISILVLMVIAQTPSTVIFFRAHRLVNCHNYPRTPSNKRKDTIQNY